MLKKIEHIGIAVKDLKASNELFKKLLGVPHYKTEQVASEGVTTSFFDVGTHKIELGFRIVALKLTQLTNARKS